MLRCCLSRMSVWIQVNLLFLGCAFILLYVSVTPVDAEACGYHYHTNNYFTRYYTGYFKRFHPLFYGFCTSGIWYRDASVYNTSGQRLYYIITYTNVKRSSSTGEVGTYSGTTNRDTGLSENEQTKRDVEASDNIQKRLVVPESKYAEILQDVGGQKRAERAFQKAAYGKVSKNSAVKKEATETKEQA
uniref:Secreted protein n=1 Tax=Magallana gigas TaxID=29159 RepID=A0A8W8JE74_MAGGI